MAPYAAKRDQALILYGSLTGDAEQEVEHMSIEEVHHDLGIETILQKLKVPFEQRAIFQKRKFLHEYETLRRFQGEMIRTYIAGFRRSIRNLRTVGVDVTATYDGEALGSRLLDRSGLSAESQRMVLIGTQQSLELETVAEALILQYPDFRGAPPIVGRDGKSTGKGNRPSFPNHSGKGSSSSSSMNSRSSSSSMSTRSPSTSSSGSFKNVYVADSHEAGQLDSIQEDEGDFPDDPGADEVAEDGAEDENDLEPEDDQADEDEEIDF